ncbi:MAG: hypothetical protein JO056_00120 [Alphaproteobacteria bacterium]|jgi:hypothetical protein|nr:hypothetical protein [Alphaproteobacteria bacterium]
MRTLIFAAFCSALIPVGIATADEQQAGSAPQRIAFATAQQRMCGYIYHDGTLIRRPVCRMAQAMQSDRQAIQQNFRDYQQHSYHMPTHK